MKRAKLIAFEGIDGSGTTTQVQAVADHFREKGISVFTTFEPSSGPVGKVIRKWLQKELPPPSDMVMATSFMVDRLHHYETEILPALFKGKHVFTDRFSLSTFVYQGFYSPLTKIMQIDKLLEVPFPDLTLVLDLPGEAAFERIGKRNDKKEIYEEKNFLCDIALRYKNLPSNYNIPHSIIDATKSVEEVTKDIVKILEPVLT